MCLCLPVAPISSPNILSLTPNTTSVLVTWTQYQLDVVDFYNIKYSRTAGCKTTTPEFIREILPHSYNITALEEDSTYEILVIARNTQDRKVSRAMTKTLTAGELSNSVLVPDNFISPLIY